MQAILNQINSFFTGPAMVWCVVLVGVILTVKSRFIQFRRLSYTLRYTFSQMFQKSDKNTAGNTDTAGGGITPFQAVATALSGTIGTGNIAGVATAVAIGGPGAIFWMWVSAFLGMATKYSEIVLAMKYRRKNADGSYAGGPMYYIQEAMGGKKLACVFAALCLLSSFGIGNMTQSNTAAAAIASFLPVSGGQLRLLMFALAILVGFVIIGGIKRIAKITSALVPAMAIFYIAGCVAIIFMDIGGAGDAIKTIVTSAFHPRSAAGGVAGFGMVKALQVGFARGVFTNEAGLGSAPIAHAAAENKVPAKQGLWGIFEVFFDTIVMCTLTGLVIVLSGEYTLDTANIATLTLVAFESRLGSFAAILIAVSTVFFALSTIVGWSYYGETCVRFLFSSNKAVLLYKLLYVCAVYLGAVTTIELVWGLSDLLNGLMMLPNLVGILLLSGVVRTETQQLDRVIRKEKRR